MKPGDDGIETLPPACLDRPSRDKTALDGTESRSVGGPPKACTGHNFTTGRRHVVGVNDKSTSGLRNGAPPSVHCTKRPATEHDEAPCGRTRLTYNKANGQAPNGPRPAPAEGGSAPRIIWSNLERANCWSAAVSNPHLWKTSRQNTYPMSVCAS